MSDQRFRFDFGQFCSKNPALLSAKNLPDFSARPKLLIFEYGYIILHFSSGDCLYILYFGIEISLKGASEILWYNLTIDLCLTVD